MARRFLPLAMAMFLLGAAGPALAEQSCGDDLKKLAEKREAALAGVNAIAMASKAKGQQMDPAVFCARSAPLNQAENALLAYMLKNKDWCEIPDQVVEQLKAVHAKSASFAAKACSVAAQIEKMKKQQAAGGGPAGPQAQPLPAGPL
jgi:hypothetical protein